MHKAAAIKFSFHGSSKGSILIFVCWVVLIMSTFSFSVGYTVRQFMSNVRRLDIRQELRFVAEAGIKQSRALLVSQKRKKIIDSLNNLISRNDGLFKAITMGRGVFSVAYKKDETTSFAAIDFFNRTNDSELFFGLIDEERKINLNMVDDPAIWTRLFKLAGGLGETEAYAAAVSVLDFRDEDDFSYDSGAESRFYSALRTPYPAKNKPFDVIEELQYVKGIDLDLIEKIRPYVTLYGSGKININTASGTVLKAIGIDRALVETILAYRRGPDRNDGTLDDHLFSSVQMFPEELNRFAYLDDTEKAELVAVADSGFLTTDSTVFLANSMSKIEADSARMMISAVMNEEGQILALRENFFSVPEDFDGPRTS